MKGAPYGLDRLDFRPVRGGEKLFWRRPTGFSFVEEVRWLPIAGSELLNVSHHLPLAVRVLPEGISVTAAVGGSLLRQPLLNQAGRWLRPYMPISLRSLPFRLSVPPDGEVEQSRLLMAEAIGGATAEDGELLFGPDGKLSESAGEISSTLVRAQVSSQKLNEAAELLLLADLLAPVDAADGDGGESLTVDLTRLPAFSGHRAASLVRDSFLPMHLLFCLVFSRRLLSPRLNIRQREVGPASGTHEKTLEDFSFANLAPMNFALDDSDLVPFDLSE